jgi:hypothetical protein
LLRSKGITVISHKFAEASPQRFNEIIEQAGETRSKRQAEIERRKKILSDAGIRPSNKYYDNILRNQSAERVSASIAAIRALGITGDLDSVAHYLYIKPKEVRGKRRQILTQYERETAIGKPGAIVQLYLSGKTYNEIVREHHTSLERIQKAIGAHEFTAEEIERIRQNLRRRGVLEIAVKRITNKLRKAAPVFTPEFCAEGFDLGVVSQEAIQKAFAEGNVILRSGAVLSKVTTLDKQDKVTAVKIQAIVHAGNKTITLARWKVQQVA